MIEAGDHWGTNIRVQESLSAHQWGEGHPEVRIFRLGCLLGQEFNLNIHHSGGRVRKNTQGLKSGISDLDFKRFYFIYLLKSTLSLESRNWVSEISTKDQTFGLMF